MKSHHFLPLLLVAAFAVVDAALLLAMRLSGTDWPALLSVVALGFAFGQTGLAAAYFIFGRTNVVLRSVGLILATGAMGYLAAQATGARGFQLWWCVMFQVSAPLVVVALLARLMGVRLAHASDAAGGRRWQMSIWELLSYTTAIALQLGLLRLLKMPPGAWGEAVLFCLTINVVPLLCLVATLGLSRWPLWLAVVLLLSPAAGITSAYTGFAPRDILPLAAMSFVQAGVQLAAGVVLRLSGFGLEWRRRKEEG